MRNIATTTLALAGLVALSAGAFASPNGTTTPGGPSTSVASNQTILFHYVPHGECLDVFVRGTTLRNAPPAPPTASGTISVPAAAVPGRFAQLFWVVLGDVEPPATEKLNGILLHREPCGPVTASPCWCEANAYAYHADVLGIVRAGVNTLTGFQDSGTPCVGPETEGATLVIAHTTSGVDKEIIVTCGNDLLIGGTASLPLPVVCPTGTGAEMYLIGADGQVAGDESYWNGVALDGGDAWQGLDPGAGIGYWDTLEFGVFTAPPNTVSTSSFGDCLNWVSTVLAVKCGGCETVPVEPKTWGSVKDIYRH